MGLERVSYTIARDPTVTHDGQIAARLEKQIAEIIGGGHVAIESPNLTHRDHIF